MAELSEKILKYLDENGDINSIELAAIFKEDHQKVVGALKSIQAAGNLVDAEPQSEKHIELSEEGLLVSQNGK